MLLKYTIKWYVTVTVEGSLVAVARSNGKPAIVSIQPSVRSVHVPTCKHMLKAGHLRNGCKVEISQAQPWLPWSPL